MGALVVYRGCFVYVCPSSIYVEKIKSTSLFEVYGDCVFKKKCGPE